VSSSAVIQTTSPTALQMWDDGTWMWDYATNRVTWDGLSPRQLECLVATTAAFNGIRGWLAVNTEDRAIAFGEVSARALVQPLAEALGVSSTYIDLIGFVLAISENVTFGYLVEKLAISEVKEDVLIAEARRSVIDLWSQRAVAVGEAVTRTTDYRREELRSIFVTELAARLGLKRHFESIIVTEEYIRNAQAVFQDFLIKNRALSLEEMKALAGTGTPVFYERFQTLIAGDYEFQKALFGLYVSSRSSTSRPAVSELIVTLDVPDVVDSGNADVAAGAPATINFKKKYTAPPEVSIELMEGTVVSTPVITFISTTGFEVKLVSNTGTLVAGEVSWVANGR